MSERRLALIVFALALALRLLYLQGLLPVLETQQTPVYGDARAYSLTAAMLLRGEAIAHTAGDGSRTAQQDTAALLARHILATRGPGYVAFLTAAFALFGHDHWPVRYLQAGIGALACVWIFLLGTELADRRAGLAAGVIAAIHPSFILFTGRILTETLAIFLFSLGLFALVRALRLRALPWLCGSGLVLALAALTRPTLLATLPFLAAAVAVGLRGVPLSRRAVFAGVFSVVLAAPIVAWNLAAGRIADEPVAGTSGVRIVAEVFQRASVPRYRGWRTDDLGYGATKFGDTDEEWARVLRDAPLYPLPAALNLVFYHVWYLDNVWREVPEALTALHRSVVILALGGVGMALIRWRVFAPLLFLLIPMAVVSVKWIEIRPNLVFFPLVFVLAGLCVAGTLDLVQKSARPARRVALLAAAAAGSAILLCASRLFTLATLLPSLDPLVLGAIGDGAIAAVAIGWGAVFAVLAREQYSRREACVVGFVPPLLFVALFASYGLVSSEPRWRAWEVALDGTSGPVTQQLRLPRPWVAGRVKRARWLVDLRTASQPPPIRVALNGVRLTPEQTSWKRLFCGTGTEVSGGRAARRLHFESCVVYREISSFTGALSSSAQWWGLEVEPNLLGSGDRVSLTLEPVESGADEGEILLGGGFSAPAPDVFHGPSVIATRPGAGSSLTRWHVARDWRMWREQRLDSLRSEGRLGAETPPAPLTDRSPKLRVLSEMLQRGRAQLNIRLVAEYEGGRRAIY